jgi:hypothetical protein
MIGRGFQAMIERGQAETKDECDLEPAHNLFASAAAAGVQECVE